jgi:glycosyltransferase involved in cell wall biosynthesis
VRILLVTPYFYPQWTYGGPVRGAYNISRELVERGHEVTVYTSDLNNGCSKIDKRVKEVDGIQVHYFRNVSAMTVRKMKLFITPGMVPAIRTQIQGFDVIHTHEYRTFQNILVHHYARKYNVPYVLQAHGSVPRIMAKRRLKWVYDVFFGHKLLRDASKVIALSQTEVQQCENMGIPNEKVAIIPNGVNLEEYKDLPSKGSFRSKFSIGEDVKMILFLGRIHKIKGIDFLVKAYAYLLEKLKLDNSLLVIAGSDDGYLGELKQLLSSMKMMTDDVLLTGPLYGRDKLEAYVDADVFVLPSRYETLPNVVLEVYSCSKPVIASNVESISDIVIPGKTGFLFPSGDIQELAEIIAYMLKHPEEAEEMGHRARKRVEDEFSIDKVADSIEVLYEKILEEKRAA